MNARDRDTLVQVVLVWAEEYEKGNSEVCEVLFGYYKNEVGNKM